jgi:hypothetical protein
MNIEPELIYTIDVKDIVGAIVGVVVLVVGGTAILIIKLIEYLRRRELEKLLRGLDDE